MHEDNISCLRVVRGPSQVCIALLDLASVDRSVAFGRLSFVC